jgi:hypothetical protein
MQKEHIPSVASIDDVPSHWIRLTPEGFTEPCDRENYLPYEPTPIENREINPYFDEVADHQASVRDSLDSLYSSLAPADVPERVESMIELDRYVGSARRSIENLASYSAWVGSPEASAEIAAGELEDAQKKILRGIFAPNEALNVLQKTSLRNLELSRVSHPYGYRMQHAYTARSAVESAVREQGGIVYPRVLASYEKINLQPRIESLDDRNNYVQLQGFLVTYKRPVGYVTTESGRRVNVIERQSAAIRIDRGAKDLPQKIADILSHIGTLSDNNYLPWLNELEDESHYEEYFTTAIQNDADVDFLIPLSTTTYAATETDEKQRTCESCTWQKCQWRHPICSIKVRSFPR